MTQMFQVSPKGTLKCMLWLDSQMLKVKWRTIQMKIRQVAKTMGKSDNNLCKQALIDRQNTFNSEDFPTENINICRELIIQCVTKEET